MSYKRVTRTGDNLIDRLSWTHYYSRNPQTKVIQSELSAQLWQYYVVIWCHRIHLILVADKMLEHNKVYHHVDQITAIKAADRKVLILPNLWGDSRSVMQRSEGAQQLAELNA